MRYRGKTSLKLNLRWVRECGQCCGSSLLCRHNGRDGLATRLGSCRKWLTGGSPGLFVVVVVVAAAAVVDAVVFVFVVVGEVVVVD